MTPPNTKAIINARVVTPSGVVIGSLLIANGKIAAVVPGQAQAAVMIDAKGAYVLPGFVDTHIHGAGLCDSIYGRYDPKRRRFVRGGDRAHQQDLRTILQIHARHGTTAMVMESVAGDDARIGSFLRNGARVARAAEPGAARLLGLGLEGQFIKEKAYAGMQSRRNVAPPSADRIAKYHDLSDGLLKKVLIVPEWGTPALRATKAAVRRGIVVGIGHTGATADQFLAGYEAGASLVVHMGNGPMSQNFKDGGAIDAIFRLKDAMTQEIIFDGHHVNRLWIGTFCRNSSFNVVGITDAMFITGAPGRIAKFRMGGKTGLVQGDRLCVCGKPHVLFGSCLTTSRAFGLWVDFLASNHEAHFFGTVLPKTPSIDEAVCQASRIMSYNPARLYRLDRDVGSIETGKHADLVLMNTIRKDTGYSCRLERVLIGGEAIGI